MNFKITQPSVLNSFCTILDFASIWKKIRQTFHIKLCVKCNWNFGGFLKIHITFYKHILNISNKNNVRRDMKAQSF